MKNFVSILILFIALPVFAQNFRTGDASLEAQLRTINTDARKNLRVFKTQISAEFSIPVPKLDKMLGIMQPAEVVLSLRIARIRGITVDRVIQSYKVNKNKGWGVIAKEMGIKPGSSQFHAMKSNGKKPNGGGKPSGNGNVNSSGNPSHSSHPSNSGGSHGNGKSGGNGKSNGNGKH